jgi:Flp pilus assembly protein protease CpaA
LPDVGILSRRREARKSLQGLPGVLALILAEAWAVRLHRRDAGIPYGIALAANALLVYPHTSWFASLTG